METVNDLDGDLMNFWRVLRDRPDDLMRVCDMTPHSRAEFEAAKVVERVGLDELERARVVWVSLTQSRSGTMRNTGWRHYRDPNGTSAGMPRYLEGYVGRMPEAAGRLIDVTLECRPALECIEAYGSDDGTLLYVDPPYLGTTRNRNYNYRYEMAAEAEHRDLAKVLHQCTSAVVLSGYHSELYDELFVDWNRIEISAWTGNATSGNSARVEVIWANVELLGQQDLFERE